MSFGILLSDGDYFPTITSELINFMIDNLTLTKFKYLVIPQINDNIKMKYTNILKETGLTRIFNSLEVPELITNNNIYLNDILQNIHLIINKNNKTNINTTDSEKVSGINAKKINTPFIYYIRINTVNTILCMGQYC
jgi:serine protease inhibitor